MKVIVDNGEVAWEAKRLGKSVDGEKKEKEGERREGKETEQENGKEGKE